MRFGLRSGDDIGGDTDPHGLKCGFKSGKVVRVPDDGDGVGDGVDGADEVHQRADDDRPSPSRGVPREKCVIQHQDKVNHL